MKVRVRYLDENIVELVTHKKFGKGYYFYIQSSAKRPQISHYGCLVTRGYSKEEL